MCTVTYIPKDSNEFLLASNRDENQQRSTHIFQSEKYNSGKVLFPVDPISGGSWIVASDTAKVACVLNGAFEKHHHNPPYARSRGLVILDYFQLNDIQKFVDEYDFQGIEPFTMVAVEQSELFEFRWDGSDPHLKPCDAGQPHIWSSTTLYDKSARDQRDQWFRDWLISCPEPNLLDLVYFHQYGGEQDQYNGLVMNRQGRVQTLSVTGVDKKIGYTSIRHHDLILDHISDHRIDFSQNEMVESI